MSGREMVRGLQERAARALPAEHVRDVDGWWLRHAPRCSWWVGTVLPHGAVAPGELVRRVVQAEDFYTGRGADARFQITPGACPDGLDAALERRGYRREGAVSLQVASARRVLGRAPGSPRVRVDDRPTRAWLDAWHAVHGGDPDSERNMLARVKGPSAFVCAMVGDDVAAVGRAVADTGWTGVFNMATLPEARGKGAGRAVLAALAEWAERRKAGRMYLQVERGNGPALRLYERSGFSELSPYNYRTATGSGR
ncbi:GNAT family N-acetyltransferase [Actinomadura sp. KC216]|uniref:GNAT family N-acetyltransferase n=1 Tax=Actinomadura sp. KC216 TaxID=2530370 RepID=UPI00104DDFF3|nr:GNAT family N-acetyltransferase [Actinomadura sp. KC216]TDB87874.1 GNAT family N-acetyltransferase [Actinomadura sp. KC216]